MIVEKEQDGKVKAKYGASILGELSAFLQKRFGNGFSVPTLTNARKFYSVYSPIIQKSYAMPTKSGDIPFKLSWSHYQILMRVDSNDARSFYEIEAVNEQWDYRFMKEQIGKSLYERLALSKDKRALCVWQKTDTP
jgi:hypothetical protein